MKQSRSEAEDLHETAEYRSTGTVSLALGTWGHVVFPSEACKHLLTNQLSTIFFRITHQVTAQVFYERLSDKCNWSHPSVDISIIATSWPLTWSLQKCNAALLPPADWCSRWSVSGKVRIQVKTLIARGMTPDTVLMAVQCFQVTCVYIHGPVWRKGTGFWSFWCVEGVCAWQTVVSWGWWASPVLQCSA